MPSPNQIAGFFNHQDLLEKMISKVLLGLE